MAGALDFVFDQLLLGKCNAGSKSECGNDVEAHFQFEFYIIIESMGTPFKRNPRQILFIFSSLGSVIFAYLLSKPLLNNETE